MRPWTTKYIFLYFFMYLLLINKLSYYVLQQVLYRYDIDKSVSIVYIESLYQVNVFVKYLDKSDIW